MTPGRRTLTAAAYCGLHGSLLPGGRWRPRTQPTSDVPDDYDYRTTGPAAPLRAAYAPRRLWDQCRTSVLGLGIYSASLTG